MTIPGYILGLLLATLYGALFHLAVAGSARRFMLYLLAGWTGFAVGHWGGDLLGIDLLSVGTLNVFPATVGAFVAMVVARWLAEADFAAAGRG